MAGIKISQLPTVISAQTTDLFPVVQGGVTSGETLSQVQTLFGFSSGLLSLANGGTNANLLANPGGIVWSNATQLQILAGNPSIHKVLLSGATATPSWSTATYLSTIGANEIPFGTAANVFGTISAGANGVLVTDGSNVPSISSTLPSAVQSNITAVGAQAAILDMNSHKIINVTDPTSNQDAATKNYVDTIATGLKIQPSCRVATTAALTATYLNGVAGVGATLTNSGTQAAIVIDTITLSVNDRVLVNSQASTFQNGIYTVTTVGSGATNWVLTRATDYDQTTEITPGTLVMIDQGAQNNGTGWVETATVTTIGTDPILFSLFSNVNNPTTQQNLLYGTNFDTNPWQRGTSFAAVANGSYTADRINYGKVGTGVVTISKVADAPTVSQAGIFTQNCFQVLVTTADTSITTTDVYRPFYNMEGYEWAQLAQKPFVVSFWVKSTVTGIYSFAAISGSAVKSYVAEYTVNSSNTWEFKVIYISASPSAGSWNYTNGTGISFYFTIAGGPSNQTSSLNTWNSNTAYISTNQVNGVGTNGNIFQLQLIKVEPGTEVTPWIVRSEAEELRLCRRYYQKTFSQGTAPAQAAGTAVGNLSYSVAVAGTTQNGSQWRFPVVMRAAPTLVAYNPVSANNKWYNITLSADSGASGFANTGDSSTYVTNAQSAGEVVGNLLELHASASAEL